MRFALVMMLAAATGYLSLSQEILWVNVLSSADQGRPVAFAHVLGVFLIGIALGALLGRRVQEALRMHVLTYIASMLAISALGFFWAFPVGGYALTLSKGWGLLVLHLAVLCVAFMTGGIFPALCHYGVRSGTSVGLSVSWIYLANILGATVGPLATGFVLLDLEPVENVVMILSFVSLMLAEVIWLAAPISPKAKLGFLGSAVCAMAVLLPLHGWAYRDFLEKVHFNTEYSSFAPQTYLYLEQSRSGVVGVWPPDLLYGDGVYDGRFSLDPALNSNLITRAYFLPALHPHPRRVFMVGLGSGSWARVLADYPEVEALTVVEINPAYLEVIARFPDIATVLEDPKVKIVIDDGRRWLNRHPDARFDAIVMNVTFHWRGQATHVLSDDFLRLCKARLNPGGLVYYNATWSEDAFYTAAHVFHYLARYVNFVAASDRPFDMSEEDKRRNLMKFYRDGRPVFDGDASAVREALVAVETPNLADGLRSAPGLWRITDDNMATEFKICASGRWWRSLPERLYRPEKRWARALF